MARIIIYPLSAVYFFNFADDKKKIVMNQEISKKIAKALLDIRAIKLNPNQPFTWASGWKSPIYCDNRISLSYPAIRSEIKTQLVETVKNEFSGVEAVAGVATAGIPQGTLVADTLDLPFVYVRSKAKGHGLENQIEGKVVKGQKVVVIEDLISTGGSSIKAVQALRAAGFIVLGMVAIFTYQFPQSVENLKKENIQVYTLTNYTTLIEAALENQLIEENDVNLLKKWREIPETWCNP